VSVRVSRRVRCAPCDGPMVLLCILIVAPVSVLRRCELSLGYLFADIFVIGVLFT